MKRIYITFSGAGYKMQTQRIVRAAPKFGADEVFVYDDLWLTQQSFYAENRWLWSAGKTFTPRGFGWFCWKPYILKHALFHCEPGDVVLYTDADTYPIADLRPIYDRCHQDGGMMFFEAQGHSNRGWVKRECWRAMMMDSPKWYDTPHAVARFILMQRGDLKTLSFLRDWQHYCLDPACQTFDCDPGIQIAGFQQHRTEQAIMSLLVQRAGLKLYREACQFGNAALAEGVDNWYPQLFVQDGMVTTREVLGSSFWRVPGE